MIYIRHATLPIALMSLLAILTSCAQTPAHKTPDWVSTPPGSDAAKTYAVGSAESSGSDAQLLALAQQQARLELAQQLHTTVSGTTRVQTQQTQQGEQETGFEQSLKQDIQATVTPLELTGVHIEKTYIEPRSGDASLSTPRTAYALASVNKAENIMRFQNKLMALDEQIQNALMLTPQPTRVQTLLALAPNLKTLEHRTQVKRQLLALNPEFPIQIGDDHAQQLSRQLHQLLSDLSINIVPNADQPDAFRTKLQSALQDLGFTLGGTDSDLTILTDLTPTQDFKNDLYYHYYEGIVQLIDHKHQPVTSFSTESKGASQYPQRAEQNALTQLAQQIAQQLKQRLMQGTPL